MYEEWLQQQKKKQVNAQIVSFVARFAKANGNDTEWQKVKRDYEDSDIWKSLRAQVLKRAHNQCERCKGSTNSVGPLQVHHNTYERVGGREKMSDLEGLCFPCHKIANEEREQLRSTEREENYQVARLAGTLNWFATRYLKLGEDWNVVDP